MRLAQHIKDQLEGHEIVTGYSRVDVGAGAWSVLAGAAQKFPDMDWRRCALTLPQTAHCAAVECDNSPALREVFHGLQQGMADHGVCVVSLGAAAAQGDQDVFKCALTLLAAAACRPFGAFTAKGFWQTLGVNAKAENLRANSTGYIPFHFDLDQASTPPEFVGLCCVRPDPFGGGENLVVDYKKLFRLFDEKTMRALAATQFAYETLFGTHNLGEVFNPHPLVENNYRGTGDFICRYNGKARPQFADESREAKLFDVLENTFRAASGEVMLKSGDLLLLDQRRILHARQALYERPMDANIPASQDRLLLQIYGNPRTAYI